MNRHLMTIVAAPAWESVQDKARPQASGGRGRRLRRLVVASLTVAGLSAAVGGTASAADLPPAPVYSKAPLVPAYNWTGCYVGAHAGGGLIEPTFGSLTNGPGAGGLAGGQLGCNYQMGQFVFGVEGEGAWSGITHQNSNTESSATVRNRWDADLALRVGFAIDRGFLYGKTGAALGSFEFRVSDPSGFSERGQSTLAGLLLGAGLEYGFAPSWTAKLEYDFIAFANREISFDSSVGPFTETDTARKQIVKLGVNYRFGN
jgi:outer membrane immunogenic protein